MAVVPALRLPRAWAGRPVLRVVRPALPPPWARNAGELPEGASVVPVIAAVEEPLIPAEQLTREQRRSRRKRDVRARTINVSRLPKRDLDLGRQLYPEAVERPRTRAECKGSERPCPFVGCAHHLYLDVSPENGSIKLNFPDLEPDEMAHSCTLDEADRGGLTLEVVGAILNITRERVRQIEVNAYAQLAAQPGVPELFANYLEGETREVEAIERQPERPAPRRLPVLPRHEPSIEPMKQEEPAVPAEVPMSRCSARDCNKIVRLGKLKEPPPPGTEDLCLRHRRAFLKNRESGGEASPPKGIAAFLEGEEKKKQRAAPRPSPSPVASIADELVESHRLVTAIGWDICRSLAARIGNGG